VKPRDIALAVLIAALWGVNFVVIEVGLRDLPPVLFCALRFAAVALPAVFFVGRPQVPWRWVVAVAVSLAVVKFSLLFAGMAAGMPAGLSAVVLQSQAGFTMLFAAVALGERLGRLRLAGVALAVVGLAVVASRLGPDRPAAAFALVLGAGAAWGVANVALRKAAAPDMLRFIVWVGAVATPLLTVLSLLVEGPSADLAALRAIDLSGVSAIGYVAWISTLVGFGVWGSLIRRYGAAVVAPFAMLAPVFAIVSGALLLHERVTGADLVGGAGVLAGVLLGAGQRHRQPADAGGRDHQAGVDGRVGEQGAQRDRDGTGGVEDDGHGREPACAQRAGGEDQHSGEVAGAGQHQGDPGRPGQQPVDRRFVQVGKDGVGHVLGADDAGRAERSIWCVSLYNERYRDCYSVRYTTWLMTIVLRI
jgi:O-acetylserine/cysteine efflux transporter